MQAYIFLYCIYLCTWSSELCSDLIIIYVCHTGNLDERVLIQSGRVVDLHFPRDKETGKRKGYAFAKYETEESADYAVRLFSGLVILYNRTLKFAVSVHFSYLKLIARILPFLT